MNSAKDQKEFDIHQTLDRAPNCFVTMQGKVLNYIPDSSLSIAFPVMESYLNPARTMQGGFITAAFDNVFGPLCLLATGTPHTTTVDISTHYHRSISAGDELIVTAVIKSKGRTKIHMLGEAYNKQNQLIATASTNYLRLEAKERSKSS